MQAALHRFPQEIRWSSQGLQEESVGVEESWERNTTEDHEEGEKGGEDNE